MSILPSRRRLAKFAIAALFVVLSLLALFRAAPVVRAASSSIVISQVYGGGGNSGATYKNDFIELFNRGSVPVDVTGWTVQYASSTGTSWQTTTLTSVIIQPGQYYLVQEAAGSGGTASLPTPDAAGSIAMSATAGKVALVNNATTLTGSCPGGVVDFVGFGGANCYEGATPVPTLSNPKAAVRNLGGCVESDGNGTDFTVGSPTPRNSLSALNVCPLPTDPSVTAQATPGSARIGRSILLTATVTPGSSPVSTSISVMADLSGIGGSAAQTLYDDGTSGDLAAGDGKYSFQAAVSALAPGLTSIRTTVTDGQGRTASATVPFTILPPPPPFHAIHDIQGDGLNSPLEGQEVTTIGIVTGIRTSGFFIQVPDADADANVETSEGLFVYTTAASWPDAQIGNRVEVSGTVQEYAPDARDLAVTELGNITSVDSLGQEALPEPVLLTREMFEPVQTLKPCFLERYEGMRVHVDSLTVVAPTGGSLREADAISASSGIFYGVFNGVARPFREPGVDWFRTLPATLASNVPRFDTNPERLRVDSAALGGSPIDVAAGQVVSDLTGPLDYGLLTYTIALDRTSGARVDGAASAVPVRAAAANEVSIASFNMQRFYDTDNDPATSDVVLSAAAIQRRLTKASLAIREVMRMPDIIGVEEVENLATLQAIAAKVSTDAAAAAQSDPDYQAYLYEGNDVGGIDVGFLVKRARFSNVTVTQQGAAETFTDPRDGSTDILNDRPPLVLRATASAEQGPNVPVVVIANHLRSLSEVDTSAFAREKRKQQAISLATLVAGFPSGTRVAVLGDMNAFEFSDGYVDVMGILEGTPAGDDVVVVPSGAPVETGLVDLATRLPREDRYSYVENGSAQVLDHILVNQALLPLVSGFAYARSNADFPESLRNDPNRPERVSDHDMPVVYLTLPSYADLRLSVAVSTPTPLNAETFTATFTVANDGPGSADGTAVRFSPPAHLSIAGYEVPAGWTCEEAGGVYTCTVEKFAAASSASLAFTLAVDCDTRDGTPAVLSASATSSAPDPVAENNVASASVTISNPPPTIGMVTTDKAVLWPPNHQWVDVLVAYEASDTWGTPTTALSVTSNESANTKGDGNTAADWDVADGHRLRLRAERSGTGQARIYTITVRATDSAGGSSSKSVMVTVPKSSGK